MNTRIIVNWSNGAAAALLIWGVAAPAAMAADASVPNVFSNGEVADADEVNANFAELESAVNSKQDELTGAGCPTGQVVQAIAVDGTTTCVTDAIGGVGDITNVAAGTGLSGGGASGDVTLRIADGGVATVQIASDAVGAAQIAADAVGSSEIQSNAVTSDEIDNSSVQQRVFESCAGTGAIESVNADGTVDCVETGSVTLTRTLIVSPVGADAVANGTVLLAAITSIQSISPPPAAASPFLVKIEPGIYDIGTSSIPMTSFVDIEGSGIFTTRILGQGSIGYSVVILQDDSELRFLTVENTESTTLITRTITVSGTRGRMAYVRVISLSTRGQALVILSSREATVRDSILIGAELSLGRVGIANVVATQLDGPVGGSGGIARCIGAYDETFTALDENCN